MGKCVFNIIIRLLIIFECLNAFASDVVTLKNENVIKSDIVSKTETIITNKSENKSIYECPLINLQNFSNSEESYKFTKRNWRKKSSTYTDYSELNSGFWVSIEIGEALSCNIKGGNYTFTELNVIGGYRLNEYLRFGIGLGARYYNNNKYRFSDIAWGMPIYASIRGNIIPSEYRNVVPYYSFDIGASLRDGFMLRPGIGLRIGQNRNAFLINLSYLGQNIISINNNLKINKFTSFVMLKIGYEF